MSVVQMKPKVDWRKHPRQVRCYCYFCYCEFHIGPPYPWQGKFWQAKYGESNKDFRARVIEFHTVRRPGFVRNGSKKNKKVGKE